MHPPTIEASSQFYTGRSEFRKTSIAKWGARGGIPVVQNSETWIPCDRRILTTAYGHACKAISQGNEYKEAMDESNNTKLWTLTRKNARSAPR